MVRCPLTARFGLTPLSLYLRSTFTRLDFTTQLILLPLSLLLSRRNLRLFALKLSRTLRFSLCFRRCFTLLTFGLGCCLPVLLLKLCRRTALLTLRFSLCTSLLALVLFHGNLCITIGTRSLLACIALCLCGSRPSISLSLRFVLQSLLFIIELALSLVAHHSSFRCDLRCRLLRLSIWCRL